MRLPRPTSHSAIDTHCAMWAPHTLGYLPPPGLCHTVPTASDTLLSPHSAHPVAEQPRPRIRASWRAADGPLLCARGARSGRRGGTGGRAHLLMMPFIWMSLSSCCRRSRSSPSSSRA